MNISIRLSTDNNIEATVSNEYKLLAISMDGLSLLTNLEDFEAPAKFLKITKGRKRKFINKCLGKIFIKLCSAK